MKYIIAALLLMGCVKQPLTGAQIGELKAMCMETGAIQFVVHSDMSTSCVWDFYHEASHKYRVKKGFPE